MTQPELASRANISAGTLKRMEASEGAAVGMANNLAAVRTALESAGVEFTNGDAPGVRLHRPGARAASIPLEDLNAENDD
jgi:transcriptional regulator with XRE-family HTH domain